MNLQNKSVPTISSIGSVTTTVSNIALISGNITPTQIATAYNMPINNGTGAKIGIVSLGGGFLQSDLDKSLSNLSLSSATITQVLVDGATGTFSSNLSTFAGNASLENTLDLYCVAGIAPAANIVIYIGQNYSLTGFANVINRAVNENCDIITISWGQDEIYGNGDFLGAPLANAVAKGITVLAASGDYGSEGGKDVNGFPTVNYPASSPNIVAVGGTDLYLNTDNSIEFEFGDSQSGGGISSVFNTPSWQNGLIAQTTYGPLPLTGRGVPDISAPFQSYAFWFNGSIMSGITGTSASTPIIAGLFARYVSLRSGKRLGLITRDYLYNNPSAFNDTIYGNDVQSDSFIDYGYYASSGWDPVTGLGSPKGDLLYAALRLPPASAVAPYGNGVTYVQNGSNVYKPLVNLLVKTDSVTWAPVKTGWVMRSDKTWERIYPTPRGINTPSGSSLSLSPYQHHTDPLSDPIVVPPYTFNITNTGDYDLVITQVVVTDDTGYSSTHSFTSLPCTIQPGQSQPFNFRVSGTTVGQFNGNIVFTNDTGYLGNTTTVVPVSVNVLPDYAGITLVPNPINIQYIVDPTATVVNYTSPGSYTYTVPSGTSKLTLTVVGGGGGGGGDDAQPGIAGFSGHVVSGTLPVTPGDVIGVYVGGGGQAGTGYGGADGVGGSGGSNDLGYNGGRGSDAGPRPWSGAGGGGGAATVIKQNGNVVIVAAGGGGGGGGGCGSPGQGQQGYTSSGSIAGGDGTYKYGDGGGAGGGGGGGIGTGGGGGGGAGGNLQDGDQGGYSGSDGADIIPYEYGFTVTSGANGGGILSAGGSGSVNLIADKVLSGTSQSVTILNSGNGANLVIANITTNDNSAVSGLSKTTLDYNFTSFTGNTATFTVTAANLAVGVHRNTLTVASNARNNTTYQVPLIITVTPAPNGIKVFSSAGTGSFVVPTGVYYVDLSLIGGGGGSSIGSGGDGSVKTYTNIPVTPGETLSVQVGAGGDSSGLSTNQWYFVTWPSYSDFLNGYGVWYSSNQFDGGQWVTSYRMFSAPYTGTYTLIYSVDNFMNVYIDGVEVISTGDGTYVTSESTTVTMAQGNRVLRIDALNTGGPGSFALVIEDGSGNVLWNTRSQLTPNAGTNGGASLISGNFGTLIAQGGIANTTYSNGFELVDGGKTYGPYGTGTNSLAPGNSGAVLIVWGKGDSTQATTSQALTISATSSGSGSSGGGPTGSPGNQYSTSDTNPIQVDYAPVSPYYKATSTGDFSFAWSRSLAFVSSNSNITYADMNRWGFAPSDVFAVTSLQLSSFSAGVDGSFIVGYALLDISNNPSINVNNATFVTLGALSDPIPDRHYRSSGNNPYAYGPSPYGLGPWDIPIPNQNQLLYLWTTDSSGSDTRTITVTLTT